MSGRSIHLIDRDELLATFERDVDVNITGRKNAEEVKRVLQTIYDDIKESPVVDAVEVIRCKDCKYYRGYAGVVDGYCYMAEWYKRYQYPDDFCSRAERKEE